MLGGSCWPVDSTNVRFSLSRRCRRGEDLGADVSTFPVLNPHFSLLDLSRPLSTPVLALPCLS